MSRMIARSSLLFVAFAAALLVPAGAGAQVYFVAYLGTNYTQSADITLDVPAADLGVTFRDVHFDAHPFQSPQYYGGRLGWLFPPPRQSRSGEAGVRFGVEAEFVHLKVYADTTREYVAEGRLAGLTPGGRLQMNTLVQRYAMTHGLNFLVGNVVVRRPVHDRLAVTARAGAGVTLPHAESTVLGVHKDHYEYAGPGAHVAAGLDWQLHGPFSVVGEYKLTYAQPEITIAAGTGRTTSLSHHFAFGIGIGISR
jgi:hypothetical protein